MGKLIKLGSVSMQTKGVGDPEKFERVFDSAGNCIGSLPEGTFDSPNY